MLGQLGMLGVTYPTLFEANCEVHVQLWLSCTRDRRLNVPSEGRNSRLWFIYPTLNGPWGRAAVWIWSTDVANQFQTFFPAVKNFIETKKSRKQNIIYDRGLTISMNDCVKFNSTWSKWTWQNMQNKLTTWQNFTSKTRSLIAFRWPCMNNKTLKTTRLNTKRAIN